MTQSSLSRNRISTAILAAVAAATLSACSGIGYRCPLDPNDKPDTPTACAGMRESLEGSKKGTGGKISVLVDDKGRLVSRDQLDNKPATPLVSQLPGAPEPYRNNSGEPVFEQSRVFQAWTPAFVDAEGNLHDGHHTWFATPGRWSYGSTRDAGPAGDALMRPSQPSDRPAGKIMPMDPRGQQAAPAQRPAQTPQDKDKAALNNLSSAANSMAKPQTQPAQAPVMAPSTMSGVSPAPAQASAGVTAPAINLAD